MEETVNQETVVEEKTFTQAEVDAIVTDRLKRERSKFEGFEEFKQKAAKLDEIEEASKSELQKATERAQALEAELDTMKKTEEVRKMRESVAKELNIDAALLTADTEDACRAQAEGMINFFSSRDRYPALKDGGEVTNTNKGTPQQQFADWWKKQNE